MLYIYIIGQSCCINGTNCTMKNVKQMLRIMKFKKKQKTIKLVNLVLAMEID